MPTHREKNRIASGMFSSSQVIMSSSSSLSADLSQAARGGSEPVLTRLCRGYECLARLRITSQGGVPAVLLDVLRAPGHDVTRDDSGRPEQVGQVVGQAGVAERYRDHGRRVPGGDLGEHPLVA